MTITDDGTLAAAFERLGEGESARRSVVRSTGGEWRSGQWLVDQASSYALRLRGAGVVSGERIIITAFPSDELLSRLVGTWMADAVAVPVSLEAPVQHRERIAVDCGATWTVDEEGSFERLAIGASTSVPGASGTRLLIYTSGTTGLPKGVIHTDRSLLASCVSVRDAWGISDADRLAHTLPLAHIHGLVAGLIGVTLAGGSVDLVGRFAAQSVAESIVDQNSTLFFGVPTMYFRLARDNAVGALSRLRLAVSGSAPLDPALFRELTLAGVPLLERYGMTETCLTLSQALDGIRQPGSVGTPMPRVRARVENGELLIGTDAMCAGYWGSPGRLEREMRDGYFATGDLVEIQDGVYRIVGRRSNLIITGGFNVVPETVEVELLQHPSIEEVAVVGVRDDEFGHVVTAFVVADDTYDEAKVRTWLRRRLAPSHCPRVYVRLAALPRNEMGKIRRDQLSVP
jgi:acyl-CoA synthetase (AMP-forming)/AMP-acid ligase II